MARFCCLWCACVYNECLSRFLICVPVCVCMKIRWLCAKAKAKGNGGACDLTAMSKCVVAKKTTTKKRNHPQATNSSGKATGRGKTIFRAECVCASRVFPAVGRDLCCRCLCVWFFFFGTESVHVSVLGVGCAKDHAFGIVDAFPGRFRPSLLIPQGIQTLPFLTTRRFTGSLQAGKDLFVLA